MAVRRHCRKLLAHAICVGSPGGLGPGLQVLEKDLVLGRGAEGSVWRELEELKDGARSGCACDGKGLEGLAVSHPGDEIADHSLPCD